MPNPPHISTTSNVDPLAREVITGMTASFFANASNVKIAGGEFNIVHGHYSVYHETRHTSNVGSFNTTSTTTLGSHNDNSQQHYGGGRGRSPQSLPTPDASRSNGAPSDAPYPNGQYFPPPAVHPALMGGATNLPPGSTIDNFNSMNTTQTTVDKAYNDYSRGYNIPSSAPPRGRNPNVGPQASPHPRQYAPYAQSSPQNRPGNASPTGSAYSNRPMPGSWGQTSPRAGQYAQDINASYRYGRGGSAYVSGAQIQYGPYGRGSRSGNVANFVPGDVQGMTPTMHQAMGTLMKEVAKMTAPEPAAAMQRGPSLQEVEDDSDSDDASSDDDEGVRGPTNLPHIRHGVANLSLADASTHPAYSQVKSDPQISQTAHESTAEVTNRTIPAHSQSADEVPQHMKDGVLMGQAPPSFPTAPPPESYARPPQAAFPSSPYSASNTSALATFGLDDKPDAIRGPAMFNTYHGVLNRYENRHHITNIDSGNTNYNLVKDSYNDNSMQSYAASPQPEPAESKEQQKGSHRFWKR